MKVKEKFFYISTKYFSRNTSDPATETEFASCNIIDMSLPLEMTGEGRQAHGVGTTKVQDS